MKHSRTMGSAFGVVVTQVVALSAIGHEVTVHHRLTSGAIELADRMRTFLDDLQIDKLRGFDGYTELPLLVKETMTVADCSWGFNEYAAEVNSFGWTPQDLLQAGSIAEDKYGRGACHFYLPTANEAGKGTHLCADAVTWAFSTDGINWFPFSFGRNSHKWSDAIDNMYIGLTGIDDNGAGLSRDKREEHLARAFYDLGHVIHLLQDMSQPGHTRGDEHAALGHESVLCSPALISNSPLELFFHAHRDLVTRIVGDTVNAHPALPVFPSARKFFWSLAQWSATNFFSEDTIQIMRELCPLAGYPPELAGTCAHFSSDPDYVPANVCASRPPTAEVCLDTAWLTLFDYGCGNQSGPPGLPCPFVSNLGIEQVPKLAYVEPWSWFSALTIRNRAVHEDAGQSLFPEAVRYSAGLLNHFFRCRLKVRDMCVSPVDGGNDEVTYTLTNEASLDSFQLNDLVGSLDVLAELADGSLKEMTWRVYPDELPPASTAKEPPVATITAYYPDEDDLARCDYKSVIVYRGEIGVPPAVEEGIAATIASTFETGCEQTPPKGGGRPEAGFTVAVRKSDRGLKSIGRFPSINDHGMVAFTGEDRLGSGAFVVDEPRRPRRVTFYYENRDFSGASINTRDSTGASQVATQEQCSPSNCGQLPYYALRRWGLTCPPPLYCASLVGDSDDHDFDSTVGTLVSNSVDINKFGVVAFPAVVGGVVNLLAGSTRPPTNLTPGVNLGNIKPSISDTNRIVIRNSQGRIFSYAYPPPSGGCPPNCPSRLVAGPTTGFTTLGLSPAFSPDGRIVAFAGTLSAEGARAIGTTPGPGVFVALDRLDHWKILRVAGESGNSFLDPGETCDDRNENGVCDLNPAAPLGFDVDEGLVKSFLVDERVGVNNYGLVVFLAIGTDDAKGVYTNRVRLNGVGAPRAVAKAGDAVNSDRGDAIGEIEDLSIYKPVSNTCPAQVAFWAGLGRTDSAILVATVP